MCVSALVYRTEDKAVEQQQRRARQERQVDGEGDMRTAEQQRKKAEPCAGRVSQEEPVGVQQQPKEGGGGRG